MCDVRALFNLRRVVAENGLDIAGYMLDHTLRKASEDWWTGEDSPRKRQQLPHLHGHVDENVAVVFIHSTRNPRVALSLNGLHWVLVMLPAMTPCASTEPAVRRGYEGEKRLHDKHSPSTLHVFPISEQGKEHDNEQALACLVPSARPPSLLGVQHWALLPIGRLVPRMCKRRRRRGWQRACRGDTVGSCGTMQQQAHLALNLSGR